MNGMRHGEGTLTLANKANYRGRWELDKVNYQLGYT